MVRVSLPGLPSYGATQLPESLPGGDTAGRFQGLPPSRTVGPFSPSRLTASGRSEETQVSACPPRVRGPLGHRGGPPRDWATCLARREPRAPCLSPQVNSHVTLPSRKKEIVGRRAGPAGPRSRHLHPSALPTTPCRPCLSAHRGLPTLGWGGGKGLIIPWTPEQLLRKTYHSQGP